MGLTIHYSGSIADKSKLPQLIEEVEEIAIVHGWKYSIYEREFPFSESFTSREAHSQTHDGKLYGIDFTPKGSEPISVCFLSNGRMSSMMQLSCWGEFKEEKQMVLHNATINEMGEVEIQNEEITLKSEDFKRHLYMCSSKTQYAGVRAHEMIIGIFRYLNKHYLKDFKLIDESEFWETGDESILVENFMKNTILIDGFENALQTTGKLENESIEAYLEKVIRKFRKKKNG